MTDCRGTAVGNEALPVAAGDHILRFGGRRGRLSRACIPHNETLQRRGGPMLHLEENKDGRGGDQ